MNPYNKYIELKRKYLKLKTLFVHDMVGGSTDERNKKENTLTIEKDSERIKRLENEMMGDLESILSKYNLSKYFFTKKVIVKAYGIPHSHPTLTLTARYMRNKKYPLENLVSHFIHEQYHWYVENNKDKENKLIKILKKRYPNLKTELPEGAGGEYSTYLHLIVNFLEYHSLIDLIGIKMAKKIVSDKPYYTEIYSKIIEDYSKLKLLFENENFLNDK